MICISQISQKGLLTLCDCKLRILKLVSVQRIKELGDYRVCNSKSYFYSMSKGFSQRGIGKFLRSRSGPQHQRYIVFQKLAVAHLKS